jgi:wyosine [tRNA(Phe)-imidazoG37] synthetase (radical SAM superfamily)
MASSYNIVSGPQKNSRFQDHIEINILPEETKVCSYNCPYCNLGLTNIRLGDIKKSIPLPDEDRIDQSLRDVFRNNPGLTIDNIVISGNGDPSLHPDLSEIIDKLLVAKTDLFPDTPILFLTNGANLSQRKIAMAVNKLDGVLVKMDAGNDRMQKAVNDPLVRVSVSKIINSLRPIKNLSIQSLFTRGSVDNTQHTHIEEWIEAIALIKPLRVQLLTSSESPADSSIEPVSKDDLEVIAAKLKRRTQMDAEIYL